MPRIQPLFTNFSWGEMSPIMQGRVDLPQVQASCQLLENFFVDSHGGIRRRRGTEYVAEAKFSHFNTRLIPFIFSRDQSWMMEFGDYYIRFYRDGGAVVNPGNVEFFTGDGTTTRFFYGHETVLHDDIEVFLEPDFDNPLDVKNDPEGGTPGASQVSYSTLNQGFPYLPIMQDWTKTDMTNAAGDAVVSDGVAGIAKADVASIPVSQSALVDGSMNIVSIAYTPASAGDSSAAIEPLLVGGPMEELLSFTWVSGSHANVSVDYQLHCQDPVQTSNFNYQLKRNGSVADSGNVPNVGVVGSLQTVLAVPFQNVADGDVFTIEAQATGNHPNSAPQINGTADPTQFTGDYDLGRGGDIRIIVSSNRTSPTTRTRSSDLPPGLWQFADQVQFDASLVSVTVEVDPWLIVTLEDCQVSLAETGWDVWFGTAPALNQIILIRDKASIPAEEINARSGAAMAAEDVFEIPTPWPERDVKDLHFVQANDIMYLVHEAHHPRTLNRYGAYDWRIEQPDFTDGKSGDTWAIPEWAKSGYDPTLGYPRTVQFFQQRLLFGGTVSEPQTVWGSRVADFHNFAAPAGTTEGDLLPDDAVTLTVAAQTQEDIQWMASSRALFIGTTGNEHRVTVNSFLAIDNLPDVTRQSQYGGRHIQPEFIGTAVMFIQASGLEVRTYDLDRNANVEFYDSLNAAWLSEHITKSGIVNLAFWKTPFSVLWCTRADGVALTMTYDPSVVDIEEDLLPVGWARQITDGKFKWMAAMPGGTGAQITRDFETGTDETWCIVERLIDGATKQYIEYMPDGNYLDSMINNDAPGAPDTEWLGADHLEGKLCSVLTDGAVHPPVTVVNGGFSTNYPATNVKIGLPYTSKMKTSKWEAGNPSGTGQTAMIGWAEIITRLDNSAVPRINGQQAALRHPATLMGLAESLFTGDVSVNNLGQDKEGSIEIETDHPYPCHLLAIFGQMGINAG